MIDTAEWVRNASRRTRTLTTSPPTVATTADRPFDTVQMSIDPRHGRPTTDPETLRTVRTPPEREARIDATTRTDRTTRTGTNPTERTAPTEPTPKRGD